MHRLKSGKKLAVVVCPNLDGFHPALFVQYLITDKRIYDEPSFELACQIINRNPHLEMVPIERTCSYCKRRGVK